MEERKKGFRHFLEVFQTLVALPVVGILIKEIMESIGKKGAEKITKKVDKALGIHVEETGKGFGDEILFREALRNEDEGVQRQVEIFRLWLCEKDAVEKTKKAEAFVLGIAKAVKAFEKQIKKVHASGGGKTGRPLDKTETSAMEYNHSWTKNFFARLIKRTTNEEKERFVFQEENFESLIQPVKQPLDILGKFGKVTEKTDAELSKVAIHVTEINQKIAGRPYAGFWKELNPWRN